MIPVRVIKLPHQQRLKIKRVNLWRSPEYAFLDLARADSLPHRTEGKALILDLVLKNIGRVLGLGTGDKRLLSLLDIGHPQVEFIRVDFSPTMLETATNCFTGGKSVQIIAHDLEEPLPGLGWFDTVVFSFVNHYISDVRYSTGVASRSQSGEIFEIFKPGGVFGNLEHISLPTPALHRYFRRCLGIEVQPEGTSNHLLEMKTPFSRFWEIGFGNVDCIWKWLELALLMGCKPN